MSIDSRHIVEQRSRAERTANAEVTPVPDPARDAAYTGTESEESDAAGLPLVPLPPFVVRRSGIYRIEQPVLQPTVPQPIPVPTPHIPIPPIELPVGPRPRTQASGNGNGTAMKQESDEAGSPLLPLPPITPRFGFEELRVDVDGVKPTMTVSGTITRLFGGRLTWIARVTKDPATGAWTGPISYRDGTTSLRPQANGVGEAHRRPVPPRRTGRRPPRSAAAPAAPSRSPTTSSRLRSARSPSSTTRSATRPPSPRTTRPPTRTTRRRRRTRR